jgi:hypothetical protein
MVKAREDVWKNGNAAYKKKYPPEGTTGDGTFKLNTNQIGTNATVTESVQAYLGDPAMLGKGKEFKFIVRQPMSRAHTTRKDYKIVKTVPSEKYPEGRVLLFTDGTPEDLTPELAKQMFNIDL